MDEKMGKAPKCFKVETNPQKIDWDGLEKDVVVRIRILKATWGKVPKKLLDDLYIPVMRLLAQFVTSMEIEEDEPDQS